MSYVTSHAHTKVMHYVWDRLHSSIHSLEQDQPYSSSLHLTLHALNGHWSGCQTQRRLAGWVYRHGFTSYGEKLTDSSSFMKSGMGHHLLASMKSTHRECNPNWYVCYACLHLIQLRNVCTLEDANFLTSRSDPWHVCTLAEEGLGGSEHSLASLLLPLQGLDVGVEPEVVVVAGRRVQVVSGKGLKLSFTHISGTWGGIWRSNRCAVVVYQICIHT